MDASKSPKEVFSADIQKDLLLLEEQEGSVNFKFGVVYMKAGQKMDDEMLSNGKAGSVMGGTLMSGALQYRPEKDLKGKGYPQNCSSSFYNAKGEARVVFTEI